MSSLKQLDTFIPGRETFDRFTSIYISKNGIYEYRGEGLSITFNLAKQGQIKTRSKGIANFLQKSLKLIEKDIQFDYI